MKNSKNISFSYRIRPEFLFVNSWLGTKKFRLGARQGGEGAVGSCVARSYLDDLDEV